MKKVTLKEISEKASVSPTTVSMILNKRMELRVSSETRHKVLQAAAELGYKKSSSRGEEVGSRLIGLIVPTLSNPFYNDLTACVEMHAQKSGYRVIVCNTERKPENEVPFIRNMIGHNVDGILMALTPSDPDFIVETNNSIPIIIIGETNNNNHLATIGLDSYKSGEMVGAHLYALGHRSVAYFTSPIKNVSLSRAKRLEGLQGYYRGEGLENAVCVYEGKDEYEGQEAYELELGSILTKRMLFAKKDITAIVTVSDLMAPGIYHTLEEFGLKVPDDVSVIGFDNSLIAKYLKPRLTTIEHFIGARSKLAIEQIINRINGSEDNEVLSYSVEYTPKLVVRDSTGRMNDSYIVKYREK